MCVIFWAISPTLALLSVGQTIHIGQYTLRDHVNITHEQMIVTNQPIVAYQSFLSTNQKCHSLSQGLLPSYMISSCVDLQELNLFSHHSEDHDFIQNLMYIHTTSLLAKSTFNFDVSLIQYKSASGLPNQMKLFETFKMATSIGKDEKTTYLQSLVQVLF